MTWKGTRRGVTPEGEKFYEHVHPHAHRGTVVKVGSEWVDGPDLRHEHEHRHHSLRRHKHVGTRR